jgi:hypothetical protein
MAWATQYIEKLRKGETVSFRPRGSSMKGKLESGQLCTVEPVKDELAVGGSQYLHLIKAIQGKRYQIGNNRGGINGWIGLNSIFGKLVAIND